VWDRSNAQITERFFTFSSFLRKFSPEERKIAEDIKSMNEFTKKILEARKKEETSSLMKKGDLLSLFMSRKNEDGEDFDDDYLRVFVSFLGLGLPLFSQTLYFKYLHRI